MNAILNYVQSMFINSLPFIPVFVLVRLLVNLHMKKKNLKSSVYRETVIVLFSLYVVSLLSQTINIYSIIGSGSIELRGTINLIPLKSINQIIKTNETSYIMINIVGNIVMFMPFGFMLPVLWKKMRSIKFSIISGFLFSLFIETMQLFQYRGTDVDDLILNTLGAVFGYLLFLLIYMFMSNLSNKPNFAVEKISSKVN